MEPKIYPAGHPLAGQPMPAPQSVRAKGGTRKATALQAAGHVVRICHRMGAGGTFETRDVAGELGLDGVGLNGLGDALGQGGGGLKLWRQGKGFLVCRETALHSLDRLREEAKTEVAAVAESLGFADGDALYAWANGLPAGR